jgi:hypothetical protein
MRDPGVELWICEARERGFPVLVTGLVLLVVVIGIPMWLALPMLGLPMLMGLVVGAREAFMPVEPPADPG